MRPFGKPRGTIRPKKGALQDGNQGRPNEFRSRRLTSEQVKAIWLAAEIGEDIRGNYPEIAEEYRRGLTAPKLVARHGFNRRYGVSRHMAKDAVRNAIRGYSGYYHKHYTGLIADRSERATLALAHNTQTGIELYERKSGIHAMSHAQKVECGRKGGMIRGPLSYELRIGCHALPPEVLRDHCRRIAPLGGKIGAKASLAARGLVAYVPAVPGRIAEIEFAYQLAMDPRYLGPVRANFKEIAKKVNEVFHGGKPHYTRITLKIALQRQRRHNHLPSEYPVDPEISFAEKLAFNPPYQLPARIKAEKIANRVNEEYHGGRPARNSCSIRAAIRRYRNQGGVQRMD